jgi:TPP-dependent pyruvate/acetoin dehydrogenase alpha subunit
VGVARRSISGSQEATKMTPSGEVPTSEIRDSLLRLLTLARTEECSGREAIAVGAASVLTPEDRLCAPARYRGAHLAHAGHTQNAGGRSSAPDLLPTAVGIALAMNLRDEASVVMTLVDEGALASDTWQDAQELAARMGLAIVAVVESAAGPGIDGGDVEAVMSAAHAVTARARARRSWEVLVCRRPAHDPLELYIRRLLATGEPRPRIRGILRSAKEETAAWG